MTLGLKITIITVICFMAVTLVFMIIDGTFAKKVHLSVWNKKYIDELGSDAHKIIAYALRASSSHNMQPWKVKIEDGGTIKVFADMQKALPAADGEDRQLLISQGTFLRELECGAGECGYTAAISLHDVDFSDEYPLIATVKLEKSGAVQTDACSSASIWAKGKGAAGIESVLKSCFEQEPRLSYVMVDKADDAGKLKELLTEGVKVESANEAATKELLSVFRFLEREKSAWRYGLSLKMDGIISPLIQPIVKAASGSWESFAKSSIKTFEKRVAGESAYIIITCENPQTADYINAGYMLGELGRELYGYKILPAMQLLQDIDGMGELKEELYERYIEKGEALIIIGIKEVAEKNRAVNPRHIPQDILVD